VAHISQTRGRLALSCRARIFGSEMAATDQEADAPAKLEAPAEPSVAADQPPTAEVPALLSGKRERKRPVKFEAGGTADAAPKRRERKPGTGTALGQIPNAAFLINAGKAKDDEIIMLHRFCYGVNGVPQKRKENLRQFSGFVFDAEKDRANMRARMTKENVGVLRKIAKLVDVALASSTANKADVVSGLLEFLEHPKVDEERVDLAAKAAEKKVKRAKAIEDRKKEGGSAGKRKDKKKKKKATDTDSESGTDDGEDEDAVESRVVKANKKKKNVAADSEDEVESDGDGDEGEEEGQDEGKGEEEEEDGENEKGEDGQDVHDAEAEEPAAKKTKTDDDAELSDGGPSNAKLREDVEALLETAKSAELTMREIRTQLETTMKCSLQSRMAFLRKLVNETRKAKGKDSK
jgi:DEK C terminal domain